MRYEHFGHDGQRRSEEIDERDAALVIGQRALAGFKVVQRFVETPDGESVFVTYFQTDILGNVWALYF